MKIEKALAEVAAASREVRSAWDDPETVEALRSALAAGATRQAALMLLCLLPDDVTTQFVPELVWLAQVERYSQRARRALAQLPFAEVERLVPQEVERLLQGPTADYGTYMFLGALLEHLGLRTTQAQLVSDALASDDAEIREAGQYLTED